MLEPTKILVVVDNPAVWAVIEEALTEAQFCYEAVPTLEQGMQRLSRQPVGVLLLLWEQRYLVQTEACQQLIELAHSNGSAVVVAGELSRETATLQAMGLCPGELLDGTPTPAKLIARLCLRWAMSSRARHHGVDALFSPGSHATDDESLHHEPCDSPHTQGQIRHTHGSNRNSFDHMLQGILPILEASGQGLIVADNDGNILTMNRRARELIRCFDRDIDGLRVADAVMESDRDKVLHVQADLRTGTIHKEIEVELHRGNDQSPEQLPRHICLHFGAFVQHNHNAVLICMRDVTDERRARLELDKTRSFFERIIANSANGIVFVDRAGVVQLFNHTAEICLGYAPEQVIGKLSIDELFLESQAQSIRELLANPGTDEQLFEYENTQALSAQRELIAVNMSITSIHKDGIHTGAVIVLRDLRDRLRMEARLADAQQQLESRERQAIVAELAGAAAHELNQPLTSVIGYAELLKRRLAQDSDTYKASDIIVTEAQRMAEIVRKIGQITRYETKSYVGIAKILDIDRASETSSSTDNETRS